MNIKKLTSTLIIALLSASTLTQAEPCINCVATIVKVDTKESNTVNTFKVAHQEKKENIASIQDDGFIPLDNNEEVTDPIIVVDNLENKINNTQKLYACDDTYKLVCDNVKQVCECV